MFQLMKKKKEVESLRKTLLVEKINLKNLNHEIEVLKDWRYNSKGYKNLSSSNRDECGGCDSKDPHDKYYVKHVGAYHERYVRSRGSWSDSSSTRPECAECDFKVTCDRNYMKHEVSKHDIPMQFRCGPGDINFPERNTLKRHLTKPHTAKFINDKKCDSQSKLEVPVDKPFKYAHRRFFTDFGENSLNCSHTVKATYQIPEHKQTVHPSKLQAPRGSLSI